MRKFFVIVLMVALLPFATGCRIGGLWGFDDNNGTTNAAPSTSSQSQSIVIPIDLPEASIASNTLGGMTDVSANILGAENAANLSCVISGNTYKPNAYKRYTDKNNVKRIIFIVVVNYVTLGNPTGDLPVQIMLGTNSIGITTIPNVQTTVVTTSYTTTTAPTSTQIAQVVMTSLFGGTNATGLAITSTVSIFAPPAFTYTSGTLQQSGTLGGFYTVTTITVTTVVPVPTTVPDPTPYVPPTTTPLAVSYVTMLNTDANAAVTSTLLTKNATGTSANLNPRFIIKFNKTISAIPTAFSMKATRIDSNAVVTFDQTTQDLAVSKYSDTELQVIITSTTKTLRPNSTYKVEFVSGTVDGTALTIGDYYSFTTGKASLMSYAAFKGTNATNSIQNGVTYVASTTNSIKLNFDYPLSNNMAAISAATFTMVGPNSTATLNYGTLLGTPTLSSDAKSITIPLTKAMNIGAHTFTLTSGSINDKDGNPINTSLSVAFTVQ
ncbi:MAG: hypothetical protein HQM09_14410 [Candidatus Riflebacteria bacterium]|nr:hypothetical protein [Candidatus Riflebacteria bacterium]